MKEQRISAAGRSGERLVSTALPKAELTLLLLILLVAATLRFWRLGELPPGFTHDEAGHGHDAITILNGARPIYQTVGYGREPLYDYLVATLMGLLGPTGHTLRLASAMLGLATLLFTFLWVRRAFDRPTALATLALQAVSLWSLATSRQALRSTLLPALFTAAAWVYWHFLDTPFYGAPSHGAPSNRWRRWQVGLFALLIGATLYTYIPARVLWGVFALFLFYLLLFRRALFDRVWRPTLIGLVIGLALAAPLFAYLQAHPEAEQRLDMLDAPLQALAQGDVSTLLTRAKSALAGLMLPGQGDDFLAYNVPGRPVLDPLTGFLFWVGLGLCLMRWRRPACVFAGLWFLVGFAPVLITGATASTTRAIGAQPVVFVFPALAVVSVARWTTARWGHRAGHVVWMGLAALVVVTGVLAFDDYVTWGESPSVRAAYQHTLVAASRLPDVQAQDQDGLVAVSSIYPDAPHDPYIFELGTGARPLVTRWFDGRRALLLAPEPTALLLAPSSASLDPRFAALPGLQRRARVTLRPDDLDPFITLYDWQPGVTLDALRGQVRKEEYGPAVNFGDALELLGYDVRPSTLAAGETVELLTLWRVLDPAAPVTQGSSLVLFTHAVDETNAVVGQEDRLDAPSWNWRAGDVIAQLHRFPLPGDLAPGQLWLAVGVYRRDDLARLPILEDGAVVGDHLRLLAVEVAR